ncbi:2-succinyl-6-hydroxy-2,4-cyclohexadiene-1-carboxylate synthase [Mesobacillus persicus]|uniref:Putative 2-succinyl-6-hydroxy-2,4-cyclohexadiene-1-carboxylate synthase n=1 Tax=Mesobacillus persicus TaxID=930146 RepID=A0A1H7Y4A3_9BACI|nr:2-succinyl-6-hydroxy-2,4-cyclohexadiene-1-carboxylate synthase [Mesobacillus persicus]SEM40960.1 2-succinyl-6-hydroxy-2,4-cyclohexadiene-1-carboxylate synthase [Mesobacillus persicus]
MENKLNEVHYHVEQAGTGFPLLMFHGFTGKSSTWTPFSASIGLTSRMIMVDLIGHGRSQSPPNHERYDILKVADDMKLLLDKLGIEKTDLLGYSMGGRLAITFAANYPEMVRKIVLESTTPGLRTAEERESRKKQDTKLASIILSNGIEEFVNYWEGIPLFQTQKNLPAETREAIRTQRLQNSPIGLANSLLGMGTGAQPSWWNSLSTFEFDTLLLAGERDEKFCKISDEMANLLPRVKKMSVRNAGHAIHVEEPEKFGTIVSEFLSK